MSAPDRALQSLNLDDMPVTRSHTRSSREGRGRQRTPSGSARMNPLSRPPRNTPPSAPPEPSHRAPRTIQQPDPSMAPTADLPSGGFVVGRVTNHGPSVEFHLRPATREEAFGTSSGRGLFTQFAVTDWHVVRIYHDPAGRERYHQATCTCHEHRRSTPICSHISWLIGRLNRVLINAPQGMHPTVDATIKSQIGELYPGLQDILGAFSRRLNNPSDGGGPDHEDQEEESDAETEELTGTNRPSTVPWPSSVATQRERQTSVGLQRDRQDSLCDILTSFDEDTTPEEFHEEMRSSSPPTTSLNDCLVEGDLPATLYRLAMRDQHIYNTLSRLVSSEVRAHKYYNKQRSRVVEALENLASYSSQGSPSTSVPQCARAIRRIVHQLYEDRETRLTQSDRSSRNDIERRLAKELVDLVRNVVERRNFDYYVNITWNRNAPSDEEARNRNLYTYLISDPPPSLRNPPSWMQDLFVIDRFSELTDSQSSPTLDAWQDISSKVARTATTAATEYAEHIQQMINKLRESYDPPSSMSTLRTSRPE